jgi:hypothetical protein
MSHALCPKCAGPGHILEGLTESSWVEYHTCGKCLHVWTTDKNNANAQARDVTVPVHSFRVVQPWGSDNGRQGSIQSEHNTVDEAFAALDRVAAEIAQTAAPSDAIELIVVDEQDNVIQRPNTQ